MSPSTPPVAGPSKTLALIVYLGLSPGRSANRDHLIDLLWADLDPDSAAHALRQALWYLRKRLGEERLSASAGSITLEGNVSLDCEAFELAVEQQRFAAAVELYAGDFLPGFAAPGGAEFERWADLERLRLRGLFVRATTMLARERLGEGKARDAVKLMRRARDADPQVEATWRVFLEALTSAGDALSAAVEAEQLQRLLAESRRQAEPATASAIRRALHQATDPTQRAGGVRLVTELVGRERQFTAIIEAWDAAFTRGHHVHVTGAPGLGKTRLLGDVEARLRASGAAVAALRAAPGERRVPLAAAADLAAALSALPGAGAIARGSAAALLALNPNLSARFPAAVASATADHDRVRVLTLALAELITAVADEAPLALLVDDAHWADESSRQVLVGLLPRLVTLRVLVVTASRPGEGQVGGDETVEVSVEALSPAQVTLLVASVGELPEEEWAADLASALHSATHGSPLLVIETLQLAMSRGLLRLAEHRWSSPDPVGLFQLFAAGSALRRRIEELPRGRSWLLTLLAVAEMPLSAPLLLAAARRDAKSEESDLVELERLGLTGRQGEAWNTAHDEIAAQARHLTSAEAARAAHVALAEAWNLLPDRDAVRYTWRHRTAVGNAIESRRLARLWVRLHRREGDPRSAADLMADLTAEGARSPAVRHLVRELPLTVRWGLDMPRRALIAAVLVLLVLAGTGAMWARAHETPDATLLLVVTDDNGGVYRQAVSVFGNRWTDQPVALDRLEPADSLMRAVLGSRAGYPSFEPSGNATWYSRATGDSGEIDIFRRRTAGPEKRVSFTRGDDNVSSVDPSGRWVAISTGRWSRNWYDVGLIDTRSGNVFRSSTNEDHEGYPFVSPDGTRLAFTREIHRAGATTPYLVCVEPLQGEWEQCRPFETMQRVWTDGWLDGSRVLVTGEDSAGVQRLLEFDVDRGTVQAFLPEAFTAGSLSPDGRWLVASLQPSDDVAAEWYLLRTDRPGERRRLLLSAPAGARIAMAVWTNWKPVAPVTGIQLADSVIVPVESRYRLEIRGVAGGASIPVSAGVWESSDTTIAEVQSSTSEVRARRRGRVLLRLRVGMDLTDSTIVVVGPPAYDLVLRENWGADFGTNWRLFGTPLPQLVEGPNRTRALNTNGDGSFTSGAYTLRNLDVTRGAGIEALVSTPITEIQWQVLTLSLTSVLDTVALATWDHKVGTLPSRADRVAGTCSVNFPREGGLSRNFHLGVQAGEILRSVPVPAAMGSGPWHRIRIQEFPDGRCGFALDGKAVAILGARMNQVWPRRVLVQGYSYHTSMSVGPLEAWTGVRGDIDWGVISR